MDKVYPGSDNPIPTGAGKVGAKANEGEDNRFACKHGWWAIRLKIYATSMEDKEGLEKCKEAMLNDFTAWIVFVALLMTLDFAALFVSPSNYQDNSNQDLVDVLKWLYIASFSIAGVASLSAAYSGIQGYNFYNGVPLSLLDVCIEAGKDMPHPVHYASTAAIATMIGATIGIYLIFGLICVIVAGVVFGLGIVDHFRIGLCTMRSLGRMPGLTMSDAMEGKEHILDN